MDLLLGKQSNNSYQDYIENHCGGLVRCSWFFQNPFQLDDEVCAKDAIWDTDESLILDDGICGWESFDPIRSSDARRQSSEAGPKPNHLIIHSNRINSSMCFTVNSITTPGVEYLPVYLVLVKDIVNRSIQSGIF
jgi:hypothetical protein